MNRTAFTGVSIRKHSARMQQKWKVVRAAIEALEQRKYLTVDPYPLPITLTSGTYEGGSVQFDLDFANAPFLPYIVNIDNGAGWAIGFEDGIDFTYSGSVGSSFSAPTVDDDPTITISAFEGPDAATWYWTPTLQNVAPTATLGNSGQVTPGQTVTVGFTHQYDPSSADTSAGFTYYFDFNNDNDFADANEGAGSSASRVTTFGTTGQKIIRARIQDKDGGYNDYTTTVTVGLEEYYGGIFGTSGHDQIEVEFDLDPIEGRILRYRVWPVGDPPDEGDWTSWMTYDDDVTVDGGGGNDIITTSFAFGYEYTDDGNIDIIVSGGRGDDMFHIFGGPGFNTSTGEVSILYVNGHDHDSMDSIGDRDDTLSDFDVDTLNVYHPWGKIIFDDGDALVPDETDPETVPPTWDGAIDPMFVDDSEPPGGGSTSWQVDTVVSELTGGSQNVVRRRYSSGPFSSGIVNGGRDFNPVVLTTGEGADTFDVLAANRVTVNGGGSGDNFFVAPGNGDDKEVAGQLNGEDGNDYFTIGDSPSRTDDRSLGGISGIGTSPFFTGGSGIDSVLFDDRNGMNWGFLPGSNNQSKNYTFGEQIFHLFVGGQIATDGQIYGIGVENRELWMQMAPGSGTLTSALSVEITTTDTSSIAVQPGPIHETLNVQRSPIDVYLLPSGGSDHITIGTNGGTVPVRAFLKQGASPVGIGNLTIHRNATVAVSVGASNELVWNSLTMNQGLGLRSKLEVWDGTVTFGDSEEVIQDLVIKKDGVAIVDVGVGDDLTWNSISMPNDSGYGTLDVTSGTVTFGALEENIGNLIVREDGVVVVDVGEGDSLTWSSISMPDSSGNRGMLDVLSGIVTFDDVGQVIGGLTIREDGKVALELGANNALKMNSLEIETGGILDIGDSAFIIDHGGTSPVDDIFDLIANAYNEGAWDEWGITSSLLPDVDPYKMAIGYAERSDISGEFTTFCGQSVDSTAVLVRFTYAGDANLDKMVDARDIVYLDSGWLQTGQDWAHGDFNYDGDVDQEDLTLLAQNWQAGTT